MSKCAGWGGGCLELIPPDPAPLYLHTRCSNVQWRNLHGFFYTPRYEDLEDFYFLKTFYVTEGVAAFSREVLMQIHYFLAR